MAMSAIDERKIWGEEQLLGGEESLKYSGFETQSQKPHPTALPWQTENDLPMEDIVRLWETFTAGICPGEYASDIAVLPCWQRCRESNSPSSQAPVRLRRAPDMNLRMKENQALMQAAKPLLKRFSSLLISSRHVVYITDADGILLESVGNDTILKVYGLLPGYDWSEEVMGTNGAGTSLAMGSPVAVPGPDHYQLPFRDSACLGSPIFCGKGKDLAGAVDLRLHIKDVQPALLREVIRLAEDIGKALPGNQI
jgi:sigma-54 dependent transcriptional regulator, acetoin dehydrogenase operon transcriptional activator AcoR